MPYISPQLFSVGFLTVDVSRNDRWSLSNDQLVCSSQMSELAMPVRQGPETKPVHSTYMYRAARQNYISASQPCASRHPAFHLLFFHLTLIREFIQ